MALVEFQDEDLKRGVLVDPDMYTAIVTFHETVPDGKTGAPLFKYRYKIVSDNPEFNNVPLYDQFSSKAMGFYAPFWEATMGQKPTLGQQYDTDAPVGRSLRVHVKRDTYNGQPQNKVDGYAPLAG